MAFPEHGFVLLAMPKCASTSLEQALAPYASLVIDRPPARKHLGCSGFARRVAPQLAAAGHPRESYELVSMFRDPVDWLASWWRYRGRLEEGQANSTHHLGFDDFARAYVEGDPEAPTPRGRPGQFLTVEGAVEVDRVLAVERPETWEAWFGRQLGREVRVERRNTSDRRPRPELAPATRERLLEYFAPELSVLERLRETGEWAGARGTRLDVPPRQKS